MRYVKFGSTGLFVSELCLGTMTFGGEGAMWGQIGKLQQAEAETLIGRAIDGGINFIDTADVYSEGLSETITGAALKNLKVPRENVVVATKVFGETGTKSVNSRGLSRHHIMGSLKASLRRLQLDYVDLYQMHGFDPATPIEETLRALDSLVRQGYVRYVGVSNWAAWQIMKALGISERLGLTRFESLQAYYTIAGRDLEREIVPLLQSEGVGLMVWSPLAGGLVERQVWPRYQHRSRQPPHDVRFSTGQSRTRLRLHRCDAAYRRRERRVGRTDRTRMAAASEGRHHGHRWREAGRSTGGQPCRNVGSPQR